MSWLFNIILCLYIRFYLFRIINHSSRILWLFLKTFDCICGDWHKGCVDAYGVFQPCMMLRHPDCVYDLKKGALKDALLDFFPELREMKAADPAYLGRCAKCFLKGLCEQCPAKSWMEYGTMDTPVEYLCDVAHEQARFLGLIGKEEKAWEVSGWKDRINEFVKG